MAVNLISFNKALEEKVLDPHVGDLYLNAMRAKEVQNRKFDRCITNWRYYTALEAEYGMGQFSAKLVAYMKAQDRKLNTYNISKAYVDLIAGGIMQAPFDPAFYPVGEEVTSLTETAKNASYCDKELCDWDTAYYELVRAGLIFQAVAKIVIINKYHPLGNVGLEVLLPNMWWADPMWLSMFTKNCRICWEEVVMMPEDIEATYADRNQAISGLVAAYKTRIREYGTQSGPTPYQEGDELRWGSALHLINQYKMVHQKVNKEIYHTDQQDIDIPTQLPDARAKMDWLNQQFGQDGWDPYAIKTVEEYKRQCVKTVICPSLSWGFPIDESPTEVQVDQIPFLVWSADRVNGEPHSLIDIIKSPQDDLNATAARINYKQEVEAGNGAQFVDETGFASPEECEDFIRNRNDPTKNFKVRPGLLADEGRVPAKPVQSSNFNAETYKWMDQILQVLLPHMTKSNAATRGQAEFSGEPAYAFRMKKLQADQALYTIHYSLRQFWNQWFECYLLQAGQQYSIEGVERKFSSEGGQHTAIFNEKVTLPDGSTAIKNDASKLIAMRHKVIISDIQQTPTKKLEDLQLLNDYLQTLIKNGTAKPATIIYILTKMPSLIDSFSPDEKEMLEVIGGKELENALLSLEIENLGLKAKLQPPAPAPAPQAPGMLPAPAPQGQAHAAMPPAPQPPLPAPQAPGGIHA